MAVLIFPFENPEFIKREWANPGKIGGCQDSTD